MKFTGKKSNRRLHITRRRPNPRRRKMKPRSIRQRRSGVRRRTRPETPVLKCKAEDQNRERCGAVEEDDNVSNQVDEKPSKEGRRSVKAETGRKLAAGVWRLQVPDAVSSGGDERRMDRLGFQGSAGGHLGPLFFYHHDHKHSGFQTSNNLRSMRSPPAAPTKSGFLCKASIPFPDSAMEAATKWDPIRLDARDDVHQIYSNLKLEEARARIEDLESEKRSQKKKLEHFLRKVSEERASWRSKEHEKVRAIIEDMKDDINREKKARHNLEAVNLKLVNELADSKLAVKLCDELAKEIEEDKAEIDALKSESMNLREEVDDERRMLQMAEVWREERVQMKLIDAKLALEEKYSQMNKLVGELEAFLSSRNATTSVKEAEVLRETVASVSDVHEVKEFTYEPAKPDDILMLFEEMNLGEAIQDGETEQCVGYSPVSHGSEVHRVSSDNKGRLSNALATMNGEFEEDDSGWETVSHQEEHRSSFSPDESVHFTSNNHQRDSNVSANGTEFQKTPLREIKEVYPVPRRQSKKVSSMAKLWSSIEGINGRVSFSNARKSNAGMVSPRKGGFRTLDLVASSPDSAYANVNRGGMKGCIEWPRGTHKNNVKTKLMEAQVESQKVQLKHVLEHKI
ncbi:LOW QUALITY PROTEIN: hypothetical protein HID58_090903 [Brassica napus]|uniref:Uncharacterized protein n=1 Tax=Brassica napus TaxID=3708 RepID=A0ABQ7X8B5_BRANA|nr:LOW QUALITY PROTEIN: hypothetical protein HID58_090903 [Brassica napus]